MKKIRRWLHAMLCSLLAIYDIVCLIIFNIDIGSEYGFDTWCIFVAMLINLLLSAIPTMLLMKAYYLYKSKYK